MSTDEGGSPFKHSPFTKFKAERTNSQSNDTSNDSTKENSPFHSFLATFKSAKDDKFKDTSNTPINVVGVDNLNIENLKTTESQKPLALKSDNLNLKLMEDASNKQLSEEPLEMVEVDTSPLKTMFTPPTSSISYGRPLPSQPNSKQTTDSSDHYFPSHHGSNKKYDNTKGYLSNQHESTRAELPNSLFSPKPNSSMTYELPQNYSSSYNSSGKNTQNTKASKKDSINHSKISKEGSHHQLLNATPIQSHHDDEYDTDNMEANQLTIQSILTDFDLQPPRSSSGMRRPPPSVASSSHKPSNFLRNFIDFFKKGRKEVNVNLFKRAIKSAIAFFLATLLVIIKPISETLGPVTYIAPILTIIFDCSRSVGAQLEITVLTLICYLFIFVYYSLGLGLYVLYNQKYTKYSSDGKVISDGSFILAIFLFVMIFCLGYIRVKLFKLILPAALMSIVGLTAFTLVPFGTNEFTYHYFGSVIVPALLGVGISLFVSMALWPENASNDLGRALELTLQHSGTTIEILTSCFILEDKTLSKTTEELEEIHSRSLSASTAMLQAGKEARYEYTYSVHPPSDYRNLIDTVLSLQQRLGAFNLAVQRQRLLLVLKKPDEPERNVSPLSSRANSINEMKSLSLPPSPSELSMNKMADDFVSITPDIDPLLARNLIHDIINIVREPLQELSNVCVAATKWSVFKLATENDLDFVPEVQTANNVQEGCGCHCATAAEVVHREYCKHFKPDVYTLTSDKVLSLLTKAIDKFEQAEGKCLHLIHQQVLFTPHKHSPYPEPMLIVFSGVFALREYASEYRTLLVEIGQFQKMRPPQNVRTGILGNGPPKLMKKKVWWKPKVGLYKWLKASRISDDPITPERGSEDTGIDVEYSKATKDYYETKNEVLENPKVETSDFLKIPNQRWTKPNLYNKMSNLGSELKDDVSQSKWQRFMTKIRLGIWNCFNHFNSYEVKFALKLAIAVTALITPTYIPSIQATYMSFRGIWAAIAAFLILNQTLGATIYVGVMRLLGTIMGAVWGYLTYLASTNGTNLGVLIIMVWMFNAPSWYFIMNSSYDRIGFNGLIAYSAILFANNEVTANDVLITACHRALSVIVGLIVAMLVGTLIWPYVARTALRKRIAVLLTEIGINFGKVSALCMSPHNTPEWFALDGQIRSQHRRLQKQLLGVKTLLTFAKREPRIKGPFQAALYSEQIRVLQDLLDQLVVMRGAAAQVTPEVQNVVIFPFNAYRKFLVASAILYFYVLSGALRAKRPLPPYPPPIHAIRYKLMLKTREAMIKRLQKVQSDSLGHNPAIPSHLRREFSNSAIIDIISDPVCEVGSAGHTLKQFGFQHIYWYSYLAGLTQLFEDLELIGHNIATLVGEALIPVNEVVTIDYNLDDHNIG